MTTADNPAKGLEGVVAAATALSEVKGDSGELIYAGYDIHELAGKVSYEEVVHFLHYQHLPNRKELSELKNRLSAARELPKGVIDLLRSLPQSAPPMHAIRSAISTLGCFDERADDESLEGNREKALRLIAQIPVVTAYFHRVRQKKPLLPSDPNLRSEEHS